MIWEFLTEILLVAGQDPGFVSAAERESAVTVKLDFVEPVSRPDRIDQLRFHRLDKVWQGNSGLI